MWLIHVANNNNNNVEKGKKGFAIMDKFDIIGEFLHVLWISLESSYVFL